ncbi:MAG TPA: UbiA family prenyltransferase, partial [Sandaracinaceae bacterium]
LNDAPTPFSGGSRVLQERLLSPRRLAGAAALAALALLALSGAAALAERPLTPLFAFAAIGLLAAYSFPPLRLAYRGGGELLQGLGVGLVLPLLGFYLQSGRIAGAPWPLSALLVGFGAVSNVITALPDARGDRRAGKRTWPVRRGERRAARDALLALGLGLGLAVPLVPHPAVLALPALFAVGAALEHARGDRARTVRFVFFAGGAIPILQLSWALALFVGG